MKLYLYFICIFCMISTQAQEEKPSQETKPSTLEPYYMELTLTNEILIRLKAFEPFNDEKIQALVFLQLVSPPQGELLKKHLDKDGIIRLPKLEEALKKTSLSIETIVQMVRLYPGPFSEDILNKLVLLNVIKKNQKNEIISILNSKGYLPGIPKDAPIIEVKDEWNGAPITSDGFIDSNRLLSQKNEKDGLPDKLKKLIEKHRGYNEDLAEATEIKQISRAKDMNKAKEKMDNKVRKITEKMNAIESDIADQKHILGYLYLAGTFQSRYDGSFESAKNIRLDRSNLIKALLNKNKDNKSPEIAEDRNQFNGIDKFILIDKTLQWMTNKTNKDHRELAKSALMILLKGHGHPPWDAKETMWFQWWQLQQKSFYLELAKPEQKK